MSRWNTYKNFFNEVLGAIKNNCKKVGTVNEEAGVDKILQQQIEKWKAVSLPDLQMSILRVLYNKRESEEELIAINIAGELDIHHATITKSCDKLTRLCPIYQN